ncbi:MAG: hypothetical protein KKG76_10915 [Euryarchaeota archaeon]|nr:hypothetical protein [Euryarchaeota archaeon]
MREVYAGTKDVPQPEGCSRSYCTAELPAPSATMTASPQACLRTEDEGCSDWSVQLNREATR